MGRSGGDEIRGDPPAQRRWPAILAALALGGLYAALPPSLVVGGARWLLLVVVVALLVPTVAAHRRGDYAVSQVLGYVLNGVVTAAMIASLALLIEALPGRKEAPVQLLLSAAAIWVSNILVFASWYWRLDAGGPHRRDQRAGHSDGAFLFPQMAMAPGARAAVRAQHWSPDFIDYLFLAFNTSTAFSPTDTPVLSRWAKVLMMLQSLISLLVIALLAARAVNIHVGADSPPILDPACAVGEAFVPAGAPQGPTGAPIVALRQRNGLRLARRRPRI